MLRSAPRFAGLTVSGQCRSKPLGLFSFFLWYRRTLGITWFSQWEPQELLRRQHGSSGLGIQGDLPMARSRIGSVTFPGPPGVDVSCQVDVRHVTWSIPKRSTRAPPHALTEREV